MKTLTLKDIPDSAQYSDALVSLGSGLWARINVERDDDMQAPWIEHDGHGIVSDSKRHAFGMGSKPPKKAGERVLAWQDGYFRTYDIAATMKKAKAEGWGLGKEETAALAAKLGRAPTAGEILAASVEYDFEFCRGWVTDEWQWIGVTVTLEDKDGNALGKDALWGTESCGDHWQDEAASMVNNLAESHAKELAERAHWEARDTITA